MLYLLVGISVGIAAAIGYAVSWLIMKGLPWQNLIAGLLAACVMLLLAILLKEER